MIITYTENCVNERIITGVTHGQPVRDDVNNIYIFIPGKYKKKFNTVLTNIKRMIVIFIKFPVIRFFILSGFPKSFEDYRLDISFHKLSFKCCCWNIKDKT